MHAHTHTRMHTRTHARTHAHTPSRYDRYFADVEVHGHSIKLDLFDTAGMLIVANEVCWKGLHLAVLVFEEK